MGGGGGIEQTRCPLTKNYRMRFIHNHDHHPCLSPTPTLSVSSTVGTAVKSSTRRRKHRGNVNHSTLLSTPLAASVGAIRRAPACDTLTPSDANTRGTSGEPPPHASFIHHHHGLTSLTLSNVQYKYDGSNTPPPTLRVRSTADSPKSSVGPSRGGVHQGFVYRSVDVSDTCTSGMGGVRYAVGK